MAVFSTAAVAGVLGVASTSFIATVSAFALNAAVGVGAQLAIQSLTKPEQPQVAGVRGKMQSGGDVARSFVFGARATAGSLVYANTYRTSGKTPNAYLTQVIALSDVPIRSLTAMWVNGSPVTILSNEPNPNNFGYPAKEYRINGRDYLWVKFYDGTQTAADPFLVGTVSTEQRPYEATRVGRGVAYAIVTSRVEASLFSGFPSYRFEVAGMPLYDLSKDSSAGGNGPQRRNNPATWGGDGDNLPAVQVYNLLAGISYDNAWLYGLQTLSLSRLPPGDWIAQINKCRARVRGPDGLEAQFNSGIEVSVDVELSATIDAILKGALGRLIEVGGIYKLLLGAPSAPVLNISDDDILSTEPQKGKPFASLANSINGITASYPEPMEAWNSKPAPPLFNADFETRDGRRRLVANLALDTVSRSSQVQRIIAAALAEARRERRHTFTLPPWAWLLEPGDVIGLSSQRNGYVEKQFLIEGVGDKSNLDVMFDVVEVDPSDYDFGAAYVPPQFSPLDPLRPEPSVIDGWDAEPWHIDDADGRARRPAVKIRAAADLDDVRAVRVMARIKATGAVVFDSAAYAYAAPYEWVIGGSWCLPGALVQVRGLEVPYSGRKVEWSEWIDVVIDDIRISPDDLHLDQITKEIHSRLSELQDWVWRDTNIRELIEDRKSLALGAALQDLANFADKQELRTELVSATQALTASFTDQITVATSATAALAQRVSTVEVKFDGYPAASVINTSIAKVTTLEGSYASLAADLTTVQAALSDKIGSTVFNSLVSTVTQQGNTITLQGDIISQIDLALDGKASLAAQNILAGTVTAQGDLISSHGTLLNSLSAQVGEVSADARLRFEVVNNSGGTGYVTAALQTRFGTVEDYRSSGFFIKTPSDPAQLAEVIVNAQRFAVAAGNDENGVKMFAVDGSGAYLDSAYIRNLNVLKLIAGADTVFKVDGSGVYMDTAFIRSISTSKIVFEDGSVQTSAIANGAVVVIAPASLASSTFSGTRDCSVTITHGDRALIPNLRVKVEGYALYSTTEDAGGGETDPRPVTFSLVNATDSDVMVTFTAQPPRIGRIIPMAYSKVFTPPLGRTQTTFRVRLNSASGTAHEMTIITTAFKKVGL